MANLQEEVAIGEISKRTLEELKPHFERIRENIFKKWEDTKARDVEDREILYHKLHALRELKRSFQNEIDTGMLAEKQLETENASNK